MKAIIYTRVSTNEQAESGLGLEAQLNACMAKAREIGATEILTFSDAGISGAVEIEKRPGLLQALSMLKRGDVFLSAKRDRIARDMEIFVPFEKALRTKKVTFLSAAGEGTGTGSEGVSELMSRRMFQVFAEIERQMIRDRTKQALSVKKQRGERVGTVPFGFRLAQDGIHLEANALEQEIITLCQSLRKDGLSFRAIVARLNELRVPTRTGAAWQLRSVFNMLQPA